MGYAGFFLYKIWVSYMPWPPAPERHLPAKARGTFCFRGVLQLQMCLVALLELRCHGFAVAEIRCTVSDVCHTRLEVLKTHRKNTLHKHPARIAMLNCSYMPFPFLLPSLPPLEHDLQ